MNTDSTISHPALDLALRTLRRESSRRSDPIIAILGPAGSGKSILLHAMLQDATRPGDQGKTRTALLVDLFGTRIGNDEEMYSDVVSRLEDGLVDAGIPFQLKKDQD